MSCFLLLLLFLLSEENGVQVTCAEVRFCLTRPCTVFGRFTHSSRRFFMMLNWELYDSLC